MAIVIRTPAPRLGSRLNVHDPLSRGLVLCIPLIEGGGALIRDLSPSQNDLSSPSSATWSGGKFGPAVGPGFSSSNRWNNTRTPRDLPSGTAGRTISALFRYTGAPNTGVIFGYGDRNSIQNMFCMRSDGSGGNFQVDTQGAGSHIGWTADTQWHVLTAVMPNGATNTNQIDLYLDGVFGNSGRDSLINLHPTATAIGLGVDPNGTGLNDPNLVIGGAWIWNRDLSAQEVLLHYRNPFQMLATASIFKDSQSWLDLEPRFFPGFLLSLSYLHPEIVIPGNFTVGMQWNGLFGMESARPAGIMQWGNILWSNAPWGGAPIQPAVQFPMQASASFTCSVGYSKAFEVGLQMGAAFTGLHQATGVFQSDWVMSSVFSGNGNFLRAFQSDQTFAARFSGVGGYATPFSCGLQFGASFIGPSSDAAESALFGDSVAPPPPIGISGSYAN